MILDEFLKRKTELHAELKSHHVKSSLHFFDVSDGLEFIMFLTWLTLNPRLLQSQFSDTCIINLQQCMPWGQLGLAHFSPETFAHFYF